MFYEFHVVTRRGCSRVLGLASFRTKLVFRGLVATSGIFIPDLERLVDLPVGTRCRVPGFIPKIPSRLVVFPLFSRSDPSFRVKNNKGSFPTPRSMVM